jgi:UDP-glucose 4-epimerase
MNILITGGAGFIGSHVAEAYLALGHRVVVVDDLSSGTREHVPKSARFVKMSLLNRQGLLNLFRRERFQVVSNHAAQGSVQYSVQNPIFDARVNVLGLLNLLEAGRRTGLKKFIHVSSGGTVYGQPRRMPITEREPCLPISPYGITKAAGEDYLRFYQEVYGLDYSAMRYSNVFGPRQIPNRGSSVVPTFILQLMRGRVPFIFGDGGNLRDYTYVADIVRANVAILTKGSGQCYNIGTGKPTSVLTIFKAVAAELGYKGKPRFAPDRPGDLRANYLSSAKAKRELGWSACVDLQTGIHLTAGYLRTKARQG